MSRKESASNRNEQIHSASHSINQILIKVKFWYKKMNGVKLQENAQLLTPGKFNIVEYARTSLWRDMAIWTKAYLTSTGGDPGYQEAVFKKLYSIPANFGTIFLIIFGDRIGEQYTNLLSQHVVMLKALIDAMASGDQNAVNENTTGLYRNADERAAFLAQVNPYWSESVWRSFIYEYLELNFQLITSFFAKDYETNIKINDRLLFHTTEMGDYFSDGLFNYIIEQGGKI